MAKKSSKKLTKENVAPTEIKTNESPFVVVNPNLNTKSIWELMNEIKPKTGLSNDAIVKEIRPIAERFARENHSYDECAWFTAEAELHLRNIYALYCNGTTLLSITVVKTDPKEIRPLAQTIAGQKNSLQVLHWMYAERTFLAQELVNRAKICAKILVEN